MRPPAEDRAEELFADTFEGRAEGAVRSPGRVNVIGDHTDYNDGFVLPIAIDRDTHIVFRPRSDGVVHLVTEHGPPVAIDLGAIAHAEPAWAEYVRGVAWAMHVEPPLGWDGAIASDVPIGAGLSSSASLELAVAARLRHAFERRPRPGSPRNHGATRRARMGRDGVRDHGSAQCRRRLPWPRPPHRLPQSRHRTQAGPTDAVFVVLDTTTRRELTSSAYNERRATCERAAAALGVASLRDVGLADLEAAKTPSTTSPGVGSATSSMRTTVSWPRRRQWSAATSPRSAG